MNGYMEKILRLDLTDRKVSIIETKAYKHWGGGHGMGSAIFWDLLKNKAISGFDPHNVVTLMTSPLSGTLAPGASGRLEIQGIGVQSSPIEWFTRSNIGGRFGAMLKFAGWDGIVIEGRADKPVWIDIRNEKVTIKDAKSLWGVDTWKTQQQIWREVCGSGEKQDWRTINGKQAKIVTTQRPAVLAIGQAGENLGRLGCIIHDAGNACGQGGFGGVWGSKNLKAISVIGDQSIPVADPNALIEARLWAQNQYAMDLKESNKSRGSFFGPANPQIIFWSRSQDARPQACVGCHAGCRERSASGLGNESSCLETAFYSNYDKMKHGRQSHAARIATDLLQQYGINAFEAKNGLDYIRDLNKMGVLGPGKSIACDLDFSQLGEIEFAEKYTRAIAYREGIGDDFAEGFYRAAKRWGRLEEDLNTGTLNYSYWGLPDHGYDPRAEVEWGYGSILGDRDINEHDFNFLFWWPSFQKWMGVPDPQPDPEWAVNAIASKLLPLEGDPLMLDFSTPNIYSDHIAKLVAWHRHYTRFWKQSIQYCDLRWPEFINSKAKNGLGISGEGEPKFFNAVTGNNYNFVDGIGIGEKIWNLDNAIWTLQGRHRDIVHFSNYIYTVPFGGFGSQSGPPYYLPGKENGKWSYIRVNNRHLDKSNFEEWKTKYYVFEGWDPQTGWPTKPKLSSIGLEHVATELFQNNRLCRS